MNGDLIFVDFNRDNDLEKPSELTSKVEKNESRADKIKRLAAQIESGEYGIPTEELAETLIDKLSSELGSELDPE